MMVTGGKMGLGEVEKDKGGQVHGDGMQCDFQW